MGSGGFLSAGAAASLIFPAGCESIPLDQPGGIDIDEVAGTIVPDELIVGIKPGAEEGEVTTLFADVGATIRDVFPAISAYLVGVAPARREGVRESLVASVLVEDTADNRLYDAQGVPNDPCYSDQWHLSAIGAPAAWDITTGDEGILVAVLDSGVDADHGDLSEKLVPGANVYDNSSDTGDVNGHGTGVAGVIAAASNNNYGVASAAWQNPILPIRVTTDKGRTTSWLLAAGIREAVDQEAKVINVSFSPLHDDDIVLRQAHRAHLAGSLVVISAGNSGQETSVDPSDLPDAALFVGGLDPSDSLAAFSTTGSFVDLTAPGVGIYTTRLGGECGALSGTSFAAPIVSGVAALIWSVEPTFRPATVEDILLTSAHDLGQRGRDNSFGAGRVDAAAAVQLAQEFGMFLTVQDLTCPGASFLQSAELAARIPTVAAIEGNARQFCPSANRGWAEKYPGLFVVNDGTVKTGSLTRPGLGH